MASWPRVHGRAEVDPRAPKPFGTCDFCGIQYNLEDLSPQLRYAGRGLINTNLLVCRRCKDIPAPFVVPVILPPDPDPIMNARPEPYAIDETDYRVTQDDDQRITEDGEDRVTESSTPEGTED